MCINCQHCNTVVFLPFSLKCLSGILKIWAIRRSNQSLLRFIHLISLRKAFHLRLLAWKLKNQVLNCCVFLIFSPALFSPESVCYCLPPSSLTIFFLFGIYFAQVLAQRLETPSFQSKDSLPIYFFQKCHLVIKGKILKQVPSILHESRSHSILTNSGGKKPLK